jgi:hypothetical protein
MAELGHIAPRPRTVARIAAGGPALNRSQPALEPAPVGIVVTSGAGQVAKAKAPGRGLVAGGLRVVTLHAGDGYVRAGQSEAALLMTRNGVSGWPESPRCMAVFATVRVRSTGELTFVRIPMAVRALSELHAIDRGLAGWDMTLGAGNFAVASIEGVARCGVRGRRERGGRPPVRRMAGGAVPTVRAAGKLSLVRVRLVAVNAVGVRDRFLEIARPVTLPARETGVLSRQDESRSGVIELRRQGAWRLPPVRGMARLARRRKRPAMRVLMAGFAARELQSGKSYEAFGAATLYVALVTRGFPMGPFEPVLRFRVIESGRGLPFCEVVALHAVRR